MKQLRPYQQEALATIRTRLRQASEPLLVNASVGAGKSLIIAELLKIIEKAGWRALCLTMNSTLISQNTETYRLQGGHAGIYCAALNQKNTEEPIIFASPMSVIGSIKQSKKLSQVPFNLIVIDECHNINFNEKNTIYMRIFHHYILHAKNLGHKLRFVGLTGTPYRGKGHSIVGGDQFFKEEVCTIQAEWLIKEGYLAYPVWGMADKSLQYDFSDLKVNSMGKFDHQLLQSSVNKNPRLTSKIMIEVQSIVNQRNGAFIFASSIEHCNECALWLPPDETAVITGETPESKREEYISRARAGEIKYLVNVNVLCTGVDVPNFDTVVFVRPTESLVLYMQALGRGLRLSPGKKECLILDYAGNLERHGDIDNPIINDALKKKSKDDPDYCINCFTCNTMNTLHARRCIGSKESKRCDHWFEFKDCPKCGVKNDIVARQCRGCKAELLDPNRKLSKAASLKDRRIFNVLKTHYNLSLVNDSPKIEIIYDFGNNNWAKERFILSSEKSLRFFYHSIVKNHFINPRDAYKNLKSIKYLKVVIENGELYSPEKIECALGPGNILIVTKKLFDHKVLKSS